MKTNDKIPKGFSAAGMAAGIKKDRQKDLGLIYADAPAAVAGVFTTNHVKAHCVLRNMELAASGRCRAILVNSGNANCANGKQGEDDNRQMAMLTAEVLGVKASHVLTASTGVIGQPLPVGKIAASISNLAGKISESGFDDFAAAILTTDKTVKTVSTTGEIDGRPFTIRAAAKGSGMIRPDMATMLCFILTDADISPDLLKKVLVTSINRTLNRITVDGDTSTNDMALILASGASGARIDTPVHQSVFQTMLDAVLIKMARKLISDAEGATKVVDIVVRGAADEAAAKKVAETICHSPLVKTALFGEDANWGRILAAAGRAGVPVSADEVMIRFNDICLYQNGMGPDGETEARATAVMRKPAFTVTVDLGRGAAEYAMITCDLSVDYVKINADYRT